MPKAPFPTEQAAIEEIAHATAFGTPNTHANHAFSDEHAVLGRELGRIQARMTRVLAENAAEIERLHCELLRTRARVVVKDAQLAFLQQDWMALQQQNADLRRRLACVERAAAQSIPSIAIRKIGGAISRSVHQPLGVNLLQDGGGNLFN